MGVDHDGDGANRADKLAVMLGASSQARAGQLATRPGHHHPLPIQLGLKPAGARWSCSSSRETVLPPLAFHLPPTLPHRARPDPTRPDSLRPAPRCLAGAPLTRAARRATLRHAELRHAELRSLQRGRQMRAEHGCGGRWKGWGGF